MRCRISRLKFEVSTKLDCEDWRTARKAVTAVGGINHAIAFVSTMKACCAATTLSPASSRDVLSELGLPPGSRRKMFSGLRSQSPKNGNFSIVIWRLPGEFSLLIAKQPPGDSLPIEKAPIWRAFLSVRMKFSKFGTGWLTTQSNSNQSPVGIPCLQGK